MAADRGPWWRRLTTVRARTTIAATMIVGVALAITSISLIAFLRASLTEQISDAAQLHAQDIATLARQGALPAALAVHGDDGDLVQIVDDNGRLIVTTAGLPGSRPFAHFRPAGLEPQARTLSGLPIGDGHAFRVIALRTATPQGPVTIYVAATLGPVEESVALLRGALGVGAPVLLALVALTTWMVVGRALRPVEAIRAEVAGIAERSLDRPGGAPSRIDVAAEIGVAAPSAGPPTVPVPASGDEISRLAATMNTMLGRLHTAAECQRRFVADASHELQTPLASARTDLEVALAHPAGTDWHTTAADLLATNLRMERLVKDLLFLARSDATASGPPPAPVDLDDIVLSEVDRVRSGGRVRVDTSAVSAAPVTGGPEQLARAVGNLLDNASHYATGAVTVSLAADDGRGTLVIHDDGPGIPAEDRTRVFERFTRLDDARGRTGGTGLGLAIAREIIEAHGGTIVVEDSAVGARLVVDLPLRS